jgi:hypothetical protein
MSTTESREEIVKTGLTKRVLVLGIVVGIISGLLMGIHQVMGSWWLQPMFFPGPWFVWVLVVQYLIPKLTGKWGWRLTPQEWVVYIILVGAVAGSSALRFGGSWSWMPTWHMMMPVYARMVPPYSETFSKYIPTWLVPPADSPALKALWYGLDPGQAIDWGAWSGLILWSTVFFYLWAGIAAFWMFLASRPLIVTERLPFPNALPYQVVIDRIGIVTEPGQKFPLFDLSRPMVKFFWIGILVGFAYKFLDVLNWIIPAVPPTGYVGVYTFSFGDVASKILPGIYSSYTFAPAGYMILFALTNIDFMASVIVTDVVFAIILPALWVALGLVPYTPGVTENNSYWDFGTTYGPFKWTVWNWIGISTGMGIWLILLNRDWFKRVFGSLLKPGLRKESVEGLPYQFLAIGGVLLPILTIIFFIAMGVPAVTAITIILLWMLVSLGDVRILADMPEFDIVQAYCNPIWQSVGTFVGELPSTLPSADSATVMTHFMGQSLGSWGPRISGFSMAWGSPIWKLGYELKVRAKDIFIALCIGILICGLASHVFTVWLLNHFGQFVWGNAVGYHIWSLGGAQRFTLSVPTDYGNPARWGETWATMIFGIVFVGIIYFLRMRFPWFWLNPAGVSVGLAFPNLVFINCIPMFIFKYLVIKIGGSKAWDQYALPAVIGYMIGSGLLYDLIVGITLFFTRSIPNFISYYKG